MLEGAQGTISVTANIAPKKLALMAQAATSGDTENARRIDAELQGLHKNLFLESNPIPVKWALGEMGKIELGIRLPMTPFSDQYHGELREAMQQAGVINQ